MGPVGLAETNSTLIFSPAPTLLLPNCGPAAKRAFSASCQVVFFKRRLMKPGPGFINLRLKKTTWQEALKALLAAGPQFGRSNVGAGEKINVEFVSANPTGPMHVGHARGAVFGDALASLLAAAGYAVFREYYINDAGAQVDVLARSAFLRYREALGEQMGTIPEGLYPGDYLKPVGEKLATDHGAALLAQTEQQWLPLVRQTAVDAMMTMIRDDLALLGVRHDLFSSERALVSGGVDRVAEAIAWLSGKGLIYQGTLPVSYTHLTLPTIY